MATGLTTFTPDEQAHVVETDMKLAALTHQLEKDLDHDATKVAMAYFILATYYAARLAEVKGWYRTARFLGEWGDAMLKSKGH